MDNIEVLICDDSALMRNLVTRIVEGTEGLHVAATAMNGQFALDKIPLVKPDVIVLDIEMPVMNGVEFLKERKKRGWDIPVIILSSVAMEGAAVTMECLELGASDFITKPGGSISTDLTEVSEHLVELLASYGYAYAHAHGKKTHDPDYFSHQLKMRDAERFVAEKKGIAPAKNPAIAPTLWNQNAEKNKEPAVVYV